MPRGESSLRRALEHLRVPGAVQRHPAAFSGRSPIAQLVSEGKGILLASGRPCSSSTV